MRVAGALQPIEDAGRAVALPVVRALSTVAVAIRDAVRPSPSATALAEQNKELEARLSSRNSFFRRSSRSLSASRGS